MSIEVDMYKVLTSSVLLKCLSSCRNARPRRPQAQDTARSVKSSLELP